MRHSTGEIFRDPAGVPKKSCTCLRVAASAKAGRKHQLVSILKNNHESVKTVRLMVNVTLTIKNIDHPLDKILKGIPAGSTDSTSASVTHYVAFTPDLCFFKLR
jgi:hypothetical protein